MRDPAFLLQLHTTEMMLMCAQCVAQRRAAERPSISTPARFIWVTAPAVFGSGDAGREYLTPARAAAVRETAEVIMRDLGFPVLDAWTMSQSRWDATMDGVTFPPDSDVVHTMYQMLLNMVFPACTGSSE